MGHGDLSSIWPWYSGQSPPSPACAQQRAMRRLAFTVAGALDDDLVAGVGQPVQRAVAQNGVVKEAQPPVHGPVAGDDEAGRPVPVEDEFVEVGGLLRSEPVQAQVVQNEQVGGQEGQEGPAQGVVHPSLGHGLE